MFYLELKSPIGNDVPEFSVVRASLTQVAGRHATVNVKLNTTFSSSRDDGNDRNYTRIALANILLCGQ